MNNIDNSVKNLSQTNNNIKVTQTYNTNKNNNNKYNSNNVYNNQQYNNQQKYTNKQYNHQEQKVYNTNNHIGGSSNIEYKTINNQYSTQNKYTNNNTNKNTNDNTNKNTNDNTKKEKIKEYMTHNGCNLSIKDEPLKTPTVMPDPVSINLQTSNAAIYTGNLILTTIFFIIYLCYYLIMHI